MSLSSTNNFRLTLSTSQLKNVDIPDSQINDIFNQCYHLYKKEYTNDQDFSIKSEDITEEVDEIINEFDYNLKRRNGILSKSIYSDILDDYQVTENSSNQEINIEKVYENEDKMTKTKPTRSFSDIRKGRIRNLEIKTEDDDEEEDQHQIDQGNEILKEEKDINSEREPIGVVRRESANMNMKTEDYFLSQSIMKTETMDKSHSIFRERNSEIQISQLQILMDSQMTQNLLNMSNDSSNEISMFNSKNRSNVFDENIYPAGSNFAPRKSMNDSFDMSFIKKDINQFDQFIPLEYGNSEMMPNSTRFPNEVEFQNENLLQNTMLEMNSNNPKHLSLSSDHSPKFNRHDNDSNIMVNENSCKWNLVDKYFDTIFFNKTINIKNYSFEAQLSYSDLKVEDVFLKQFIILLNKENFFNDEINSKIKTIFGNRFEIYFFESCRKFLNLKKELYCESDIKKVALMKNNIIKHLEEINFLLKNNIFLIDSEDFYIFKPLSMLKFWDNTTEDLDISTYNELIKLFLLKTILKKNKDVKNLIKAFKQIKIVFNEPNIFDKAQIFLYYFGKLLALFIEKVEAVKDEEILTIINKENKENYMRIKKILLGFGYPHSNNYKKRAKNYWNLAKVSEYFGEDLKMTELYLHKSKRYFEFYNNPNKMTLSASGQSLVTAKESFGSEL